jgi:MtrB/PioB family decaheme-associated outer membrane protein
MAKERRMIERRRRAQMRSALMAATAVAAGLGSQARADSAVGTNTSFGSQLNPNGQILTLPTDHLSNFWENSRSPTGLLYPRPFLLPEMVQSTSDPDWWSSGWMEFGYLGTAGKTGTAFFREYGDWSNGLLLSNAGFLAENRKSAFYVSGNVGNVARDDQYYQLTLGKYGLFSTSLFFDSIPHIFSTDARLLWNGAGTGRLTLPAGLTPGASTPAQVQSALAALLPGELSLTREKAGLSASYTPYDMLELFFRFGNEWRDGTRPLGATFGYPGQGGATEIAEPIHYRTLDVSTGIRLKGHELQANLTYAGSFFRNDIPALIWDNPGLTNLAPGAFIPTQGQMALPPNNDYHTFKGDMAWAFSPKTRFTASAAYATMRQNAALLPPTIDSGIINGVSTAIDLANWNTTNALSQQTAHAAIDTLNAFAQLQFNPTPELRLDFEVRDRDQDNKTNYLAFNLLTGQYGYIAIDGGLAPLIPRLSGVYEPSVAGERVQIRNVPFETDTLDLTAKANYRLANRDSIGLSYTREQIHRTDREVPNGDDNRITAQYSSRAHEWGTFRLSYSFASLGGDDYASYPYSAFNSTSLPGYISRFSTGDVPFTLDPLRKYDVADRTEHAVKAQTNFLVSEKTDFQLTGSYKNDSYDADYGLHGAVTYDANAALTYQMSLGTTFNVFYSFQAHNRDVSNINPQGRLGSSADAGSLTYPLANAWNEKVDDQNHVVGAGIHHRIDKVTIDVNYTFTHSNSAIGYGYASTAAFFNLLTPAQAVTGFPDTVFDHHLLETSILWKYTEKLAVRAYYRLEYEHLDDFHYTGLTNIVGNNLYLGAIPENYTAHVMGIFFQYVY